MNTETQDIQTLEIPFKKLIAWEENVRTTVSDRSIEELAASIASVGLLQTLVVKKAPKGKYAVIAGKRRLKALSLLAEAGTLPTGFAVPCRLAAPGSDLTEISLAENVVRESMSPVDELLAFQRLIDEGKSAADIAARFGVTEAVVNKRLALARVSPSLLEQYRAGVMNLELLQAFTLSNDHAAQEEVWNQLPAWSRNASAVRRMLSQGDIPASDANARFIGIPAYEAAGGITKRDLFHDEEGNGVYLCDTVLLSRLVAEKLEQAAAPVQNDGWRWVEIQPDANSHIIGKYRRIQAKPLPLPAKLEAKLTSLERKLDTLSGKLKDEDEEGEGDQLLYQQVQALEEQIDAIHNQRQYDYSTKIKSACGVIVTIGAQAQPRFIYGLLRKEDQALLEPKREDAQHDETANETADSTPPADSAEEKATSYSAALIEYLTAEKTAAIAVELTRQPQVALAAVAHVLLLRDFALDLGHYRTESAIQISARYPHLESAKSSKACLALEDQRAHWLARLHNEAPRPGDLFPWCSAQSPDTLLSLIAFCAARTLTAIEVKGASTAHFVEANALASALKIDLAQWFTPTAENFFGRISKPQIAQALSEAGKAPDSSKLAWKKAPLAEFAEREIAGTHWLPEPLRIATPPPAPQGKE
jgi:ParB family chromosome partitioning protein